MQWHLLYRKMGVMVLHYPIQFPHNHYHPPHQKLPQYNGAYIFSFLNCMGKGKFHYNEVVSDEEDDSDYDGI
jgi:hypothetical protein